MNLQTDCPPPILDACCGTRMMWFDRDNPAVLFADNRRETVSVKDSSHGRDGKRVLKIDPDMLVDFRAMPFPDESFWLVVFDPPHLVRAGRRSWLAAKYGTLGKSWQDDLAAGFRECVRVLKPCGSLIFKWNETQIPISQVLPLCPLAPAFGHTSGARAKTHWVAFFKPTQGC